MLKLNEADALQKEVANGRCHLAKAALMALQGESGAEADNIREDYLIRRDAIKSPCGARASKKKRALGLSAIRAEREELERMRADDTIGADTYLLLQEELDWNELTLLSDDERRIEES
jgi:CPA1 family monovalent cation:H+ antiporter